MIFLGLTLDCRVLKISGLTLLFAFLLVKASPQVSLTVVGHALGVVPIACAVLIGAIGVLATVLASVYPAIDGMKDSLGDRGVRILVAIEATTKEIRENTLLAIYLAAFVYLLIFLGPLLGVFLLSIDTALYSFAKTTRDTVLLSSIAIFFCCSFRCC